MPCGSAPMRWAARSISSCRPDAMPVPFGDRRSRRLWIQPYAGQCGRRVRAVGLVRYRLHSRRRTDSAITATDNSTRVSGNVGYQFSPNVETRFYLNANESAAHSGPVTRATALTRRSWRPRQCRQRLAAQHRHRSHRQQDHDPPRQYDFDFGAFSVDRHLMHPIFQWLDYHYEDYGGFAQVPTTAHRSGSEPLVAGVNVLNGTTDNRQFANVRGFKGTPSSSLYKPENNSPYAENSLYFLPQVAFVAGTQYLFASREQLSISRPMATSMAAHVRSGARNRDCSGTSIRPGKCLGISRAAPKFRASARARSDFRIRPFRIFRSP